MSTTSTPFGAPGSPVDEPDYVDAESVASGPAGIAEEIVKLGRMVAGTQARIVADESATLTSTTAAGGDLTGMLPNPVVAKIHGVAIATPPNTTGVFLRGDGTWTAPAISVLDGITITGTPSAGQVLVATSATTASWQTLGSTAGSYTANYLAQY